MLNNDQKAELKAKLEAEKAVLEEELGRIGVRNPSNPSDWVQGKPAGEEFGADQNDNANVIGDMHDNNASMTELEGRLNTVIGALEKMEAGTYGVCEFSGHDIELDRLNANPAARTCKEHMKDESTLP